MKKIIYLSVLLAFSLISFAQVPTVTLNNGLKMPILGFGTLELRGPEGARNIAQAIAIGYRLFDTATVYGNEETVGDGIKQSGIDRKDLFVTTKLWVDDTGYEKTKKAFETSLKKLGLEYIDLYLIHRPRGDLRGAWKAMEELYESGKIKAIGVSNFEPEQLDELLTYAKVKPVVNQIENHPFFQQNQTIEVMKKLDIQTEAWSPLAGGRNDIFTNATIAAIALKHNKTNAQICLRWLIERGVVAIPRTANAEYMKENINIFDFELDESDMQQIAKLDLNTTQFPEWE